MYSKIVRSADDWWWWFGDAGGAEYTIYICCQTFCATVICDIYMQGIPSWTRWIEIQLSDILNVMINKWAQQWAGYRDAVVHQRVGIHDGDQLVKEVWLGLKQLWCQILHDRLEVLCSVTRGTIPRLWLPPAHMVKTVIEKHWTHIKMFKKSDFSLERAIYQWR